MKRVLITGASGFVGQQCLLHLLASGFEVHAVTRSTAPQAKQDAICWHVADLLDATQVADLLARVRPTHLLHLAWCTQHGRFWTATENLHWVRASLGLAEAFVVGGGRRLVGVGTCAEYAPPHEGRCVEVGTPLQPATLYGACKHALHLMLEAFGKQAGISTAWARVFFPYGPGETPERLVPFVTRALLAGEPARCTHGNQVRDFIFVKDAASALVTLLDSQVEGAVNIGSGKPVALRELIHTIAISIGRPELVRLGAIEVSQSDPPALWADVTRLRDEVGWSPRYDLDVAIRETIDWWREN